MNPPASAFTRRLPFRRVAAARLALLALCALPAAGCWAAEPVLAPRDPPANVPPGLLLVELPPRVVDSLAMQRVADQLAAKLLEEDMGLAGGLAGGPPAGKGGKGAPVSGTVFSKERRAQIVAHRVMTGMSVQEVIWCFLADPSRSRLQGPPGGQTLMWEPRNTRLDRYYVRFDEDGKAADAGRY